MRVFYGYFSYPHLSKIAKHLQVKYGWEPVYWNADSQVQAEVTAAFPGITFQDMTLSQRAIHTNELAHVNPAVVDKEIIDALAIDQITAMKIYYRADATGRAFSFDELIDFHYENIKYWLTVIREKKFDLYVCWCDPHGVDYVLYQLCKLLGIKVLYIDSSPAITKDTHLIASSLDDRSQLLKKKMQNLSTQYVPHLETMEQIRRQQGPYTFAKPYYMTAPHLFGESGKWVKRTLAFAREIASTILRNPFSLVPNYMKFKAGPYQELRTGGNRIQNFLYTRRTLRNKIHYKKIYNQYLVKPDFSKNYIYFAASFQPEATTLPGASVYNSLPLILDMLSAALPDDWIIYYKEHPTTFDSIIPQNLYRGEEYYERVSKIPKVKMVDYKIDTFQMIDHSRAVATATGTVGWEAVVRGKMTLTFGEAWYNACDGVLQIKSFNELVTAIGKIKNGLKPDPNQVTRFAGVVDQFCCKDLKNYNIGNRYVEMADVDEEMKRYAEYFARAYDEYYGSKGV